MPPNIIPNKYERLTYYILDNYNSQLECETCHTKYTSDGTAFVRDQGGSKDGMYYRQFRCKGKAKGKCSTAYTHEDFLALATRQLGGNQMEQIRIDCGFPLELPSNSQTSSVSSSYKSKSFKCIHDGTSTGLTPSTKRVLSRSDIYASPPPFLSDFPNSRENIQTVPLLFD
jgi:hypothetical protein